MAAYTHPREFTITIDILGPTKNVLTSGVNIRAVVESISLSRPEFDATGPNGYHDCTGSLTLKAFNNVNFTTSLDPRSTTGSPTGAALYAYGNRVNIAIADTSGVLRPVCPMFIVQSPDPANLGANPLVLNIGDESKLIDHDDTPEGNQSGVTRGTSRSASAIANSVLAANGLPISADVVNLYPVSAEVQKNNTDSWPSFIGGLMGNRGRYAWLDSAGATRFTLIDFDQATPALSLTIGGDNGDEVDGVNGWARVKADNTPPQKLTCYATGAKAVEISPNPRPISETIPGDGFTAQTVTGEERWAYGSTPTYTLETTTRKAERLILPEVRSFSSGLVTGLTPNASTTLRDSATFNRTIEYSSFYGHALRETKVERLSRAESGGNAYDPSLGDTSANALTLIETRTTIEYTYNGISGYMERRTTSVIKPWAIVPWTNDLPQGYASNRFLMREVYRNTETWEKVQGNAFGAGTEDLPQRWRYQSTVLQPRGVVEDPYFGNNADILVVDHNESFDKIGTGAGFEPPSPEYMQEQYELKQSQYEGSATFTPQAGAAYKNREEHLSLRGADIASSAQCSFLARLLGLFRYGRANGYQFVGAIPDWLLTSYSPGARIDVSVEGQVLACLLDGWTLTIDNASATWGCSLVFVGVVGVAPSVVTPPTSVASSITHAVTAPSPIFSAAAIEIFNGQHAVTAPSPIFSATAIKIFDAQYAVTAPSPIFSASNADPNADALFARLTGTYSAAELAAINTAFTELKSNNLYSKIATFVFLAMDIEADARLNWISTSHTATNGGGMTFTSRQGFTGTGTTTSFLDTNFIPSASAVTSQNSSAITLYIRSSANNGFSDYGGRSASGQRATSFRVKTSGTALTSINVTTIPTGVLTTGLTGLHTLSRTSSTGASLYRNGVFVATSSATSVGEPTVSEYLGAIRSGSLAQDPSTAQYAFYSRTSGLNATEAAAFNTIVTNLLTAFGANV